MSAGRRVAIALAVSSLLTGFLGGAPAGAGSANPAPPPASRPASARPEHAGALAIAPAITPLATRQGQPASSEPGHPLPPHVAEAVANAIAEEMTLRGIPGLSAAIAEGADLRFAAGYGLADVENEVEAGPDTVYRLASVAKPITAAAALRLAQKGSLDLDAPVWSYCAAYPAKPWPVSTRQLLCHQGGVRHYRQGEQPPLRHYASIAEGLALFRDDPLVFEPGTSVLYSTYAFSLLGCVLEGASGRSYAELLRDEVFTPAGMASTQPDDVRSIIPHRASGYVRAENGDLLNSALADTSYKLPGGGLCGTAPDVARFGLALVNSSIVNRSTLQLMLTPQKTRRGRVTGFGLGITVTTNAGRREAWHTGGQERVSTVLYTRPDSGLSIALLSNLEGVGTPLLQLARRIADIVLAERPAR